MILFLREGPQILAFLDSLKYHLAVLDPMDNIVDVNESWLGFAREIDA